MSCSENLSFEYTSKFCLSDMINIVFNVVCAARLANAELPSSASDAVLCSVLVRKM